MPTDPISMIVSLFFILNVMGNLPLFIALLRRYSLKNQRKIILRELLIALGILLIFSYFGEGVLSVLGISRPIIGIAGGLLLLLISLTMIFPKHTHEDLPHHEPIIVPLAIPIVAGPGSITAVMVFAAQLKSSLMMTGIVLTAWIPSLIIVLLGTNIKRYLGEKGMLACERLGGMLVSLIAIQMFTSGVIELVKINFNLGS